jgi:Spy/CpxP family protein refolding chaperone
VSFNNSLQPGQVLHFLTNTLKLKSVQMAEVQIVKKETKLRRTLVVLLMVFGLITSVFAQNPRRFGGPPSGDGTDTRSGRALAPLAGLKNALNLTDAQVTAIQALLQTRATRAQALRTEIGQKRTALDTLLNAATPNPTDVGNAAIALSVSEKKLPAERDWFIGELKKLLTGDQQQKLDTLLAANPRLPLLGGPGGPGGPGPRGLRGPQQ